MRTRMTGKFLPVAIAGVLLVVLVPLVAAFEAHTINVTAHVEHRFNVTKTIRPATSENITYATTSSNITFPSTPYTGEDVWQDGDGVWHVPEGEVIVWMVEITVRNPHGYDMYDVMVRDHFGAELTGMDDDNIHLSYGTVGDGIYWIRGAGEVSFTELHPEVAGPVLFYYKKQDPPDMPQFTIFWYATYIGGDPHMNQPVQENDLRNKAQGVDNSDYIGSGESTTLTLMVWTRINPGGHQEYTSSGNYDLNSGPTAWWLDDEEGQQFSSEAPSIPVIVD